MKICVVSDTHGKFPELPSADLLIHAGDMCNYGSAKQLRRNIDWLKSERWKFKEGIIVVPGNHDRCLDPNFCFTKPVDGKVPDFWQKEKLSAFSCRQWFEQNDIMLLINENRVIHGYNFYGTPYVLPSGEWAFGRNEDDLQEIYSQIPDTTDVLITHGGSFKVLDYGSTGHHFGSVSLQTKIQKLANLKLHVFGHIHYCPGICQVPFAKTSPQSNKNSHYVAINATYQNENDKTQGNDIHVVEI